MQKKKLSMMSYLKSSVFVSFIPFGLTVGEFALKLMVGANWRGSVLLLLTLSSRTFVM